MTRARRRLVLAYPAATERGARQPPSPFAEEARAALGARVGGARRGAVRARPRRCSRRSGCCATSCSTTVAAGRRAARRAALRHRPRRLARGRALPRAAQALRAARAARDGGQSVADALPEVNARLLQAATAEQREIFETSALDEYLLDAERDEKRARGRSPRAPSRRSSRSCPRAATGWCSSRPTSRPTGPARCKYKFARVFRIPPEPTLNQRFGILVHQVLERFHGGGATSGSLPELLGLLEAGWRRGGFGDSEEERQLRAQGDPGAAALPRALPGRGRRAGLVRARVLVPARARTCCAGASTASTSCPTAATS